MALIGGNRPVDTEVDDSLKITDEEKQNIRHEADNAESFLEATDKILKKYRSALYKLDPECREAFQRSRGKGQDLVKIATEMNKVSNLADPIEQEKSCNSICDLINIAERTLSSLLDVSTAAVASYERLNQYFYDIDKTIKLFITR